MSEPGPLYGGQVWTVDLALSEAGRARCAGVLSSEEETRAGRFLRAEDQARYRTSHAALRLILGLALDADPRRLRFTTGPAGKPALAGPDRGLAFNLSHSGSRALVGLSRQGPIGVDVEAVRPLPDALRIAHGHFAPDEAASLAALPAGQVEAAFFALWTRKEAVVKALGAGLSLPLADFSVSLPPDPPRLLRILGGSPRAWTLRHLEPGPGTVGAAAIASAEARLSLHALPAGWPDALP
ncbi:4'-phosphopantetheinyl transferase family protein [Methylobacterium trifolii]|uniref:4'-phosphopantetheinyl transferase family protein n=1 Tax=Methylobacterium trifolii TaxID=1003092 RepID=UPI001EDD7966|nr:4'-phosphopantetheinyl transferase superfamily protein [Methylobacterium trifolii]